MKFVTRDYRWTSHQSSSPGRELTEAAMLAEIGRDLRSMYSDILKEPLPEHLICIAKELDRQDHRRR